MKDFQGYFDGDFDTLNEAEKNQFDELVSKLRDADLENIEEGTLSDIIGGTVGFIIGPSIGRRIANALGIEKGILYDMFTSKLVNAALGAAIAKRL